MSGTITVGFVISSPEWRGSVASFVTVAEGLRNAGHRALFIPAHDSLGAELRARGHEVEVSGAVGTGPADLLRMRRILRRHGVGATYADMPRDLRLAAIAGKGLARAAWRFNVNAGKVPDDLLTRLAARWTGTVVVLSEWVAARIRESAPWLTHRPVERIPNGFDLERWRRDPSAAGRVRGRLGIAADRPIILCASMFAQRKRQEFVIEAVERWPAAGPRPVLLLAGGDEAEAPFRDRARASSAEVRFVGRPGAEGLRELYSAADVVAQPAANESFGNVIAEAMCCEAAVLVPAAGAAPEVVGAAGVVLPAEDAGRWARELASLAADPGRRATLGAAARERIARHFPIARMQEAHLHLFERLHQ